MLSTIYMMEKCTPRSLDVIGDPFVALGTDVMAFGYAHEPNGPDQLTFNRRVLKGYVAGLPRPPHPDAFELSFPSLFGMSGSPLILYGGEGEAEKRPAIAGVMFGNREARISRHSVIISKEEALGRCETVEERIARILELGLAYKAAVLVAMVREVTDPGPDIEFTFYEDRCEPRR